MVKSFDMKNQLRNLLGTPNGKMCLIILAALCVFVITSSMYSVNSIDDMGIGAGPMGTRPIPEATNRSHVEGAGFAFLALGAQANQMNCPAAIESLVRFSGWNGDVYLITDQEYCFNPQEIISNSGIPKDRFHYIVTEENFNRGGFDFEHPDTIGFRMARVRSLNMKTKLFELISDPKIHTIAYVDCDILFTQPQCAQEFVSTGPSWEDFPIRFSHVFRNAKGDLQDIHAGSFVVHREHSMKTLSMWHDQIALGTDEGDNDAFMRVYRSFEEGKGSSSIISDRVSQQRSLRQLNRSGRRGRSNNDTRSGALETSDLSNQQPGIPQKVLAEVRKDSNTRIIPQLHAKGYKNPLEPGEISRGASEDIEDQRNWFEKFIELENPREFCMQHIPKARCARYGRKKIQNYVDRFRLKSYAGGHMYCASAFLRPLLYGWFPLGYLPFCPKMEQIL
jgi:hypothetical protein